MTLDSFVTLYNGKQLASNNGTYLGECVSLVKRYAQESQGVAGADTVLQVPLGARQLYEGFNWNGKMAQYYDKIPFGQPRIKGDFVVWGANLGQYGDVAIALDSNNSIFGQLGDPVYKPASVRVELRQPLGYLRFKGGNDVSTVGEVEFNDLYIAMFGPMENNPPTDNDRKRWIGTETNSVIRGMQADPRRVAYQRYVNDLKNATGADFEPLTEPVYIKK